LENDGANKTLPAYDNENEGFSPALNRQPLKPDWINKKSAGCIDTRHTGTTTFVQPIGLTRLTITDP
jgi:hypothetical protein